LENVMQRAIIVSTNGSLSLDDIALPAGGAAITIASGTSLVGVERAHILRVLELSSWRIDGSRGAADLLGMKPSTLRSRLRKLQVQRPAQVRCGRGVAS
jgi:transcriptional regulator of acetoin/glycerol metabolism